MLRLGAQEHLFKNYFYFKNSILYYFQVYDIVVRHLYHLYSDLPGKSSSHLAPNLVITILLAIFPVLALHPRTMW